MDERARLKELREQARNAVRGQKLENSPLYIACQSCGAPADSTSFIKIITASTAVPIRT